MSVPFQSVDNIFDRADEDTPTPGLGEFRNESDRDFTSMIYICPCGCGQLRCIHVREPLKSHGDHVWGWNGDQDKPTLTPSIQHRDLCEWHGWLKDGQFKSC